VNIDTGEHNEVVIVLEIDNMKFENEANKQALKDRLAALNCIETHIGWSIRPGSSAEDFLNLTDTGVTQAGCNTQIVGFFQTTVTPGNFTDPLGQTLTFGNYETIALDYITYSNDLVEDSTVYGSLDVIGS
jgi:hypothetical protein